MRGLIGTLGLATLIGLIFFAALVAVEMDWGVVQAEVFNASIEAWNTLWEEGIDFLPLLPALGWVLGFMVGLIMLSGLLSVLGGMVFGRRKVPQDTKPEQPQPLPAVRKSRRWFSRAPQLHASEKEIFSILAETTGYTVRNWNEALEACRRHIAEGKGTVGVLEALNGPRFARLAGLTFGNPFVMRAVMEFVCEAKIPTPRAPRTVKPKSEKSDESKAPATPAPATTPVEAAEPAPPAQAEVAQPAAGPTAAAAARVDITIRSGTGQADDTVVVEEVAVTPTPAAEPPIPPAEAPMGDRKGKRGGGRKPFDQRYKGFSG